jgi:hypothetical protein
VAARHASWDKRGRIVSQKPPTKRKGAFDDSTMVGLKPIESVGDVEHSPAPQKAAKKKSPFDDPTMKHVANAPRPSRTKYDDETQRALAPLESNPPSAPVSSIATSVAAETQESLRVSHVDPTLNMDPADAPISAKKTMEIGNVVPPPAMTSPRAQTVERRQRPETIAMEPQAPPPESTKISRTIVEQWLAERRSFQGVDLSGADLRALDLRSLDFRGAKLNGAQLDGARLDGANLMGVDLSEASAVGISARRVAARGSVWDKSDVTDATFEGADLAQASFRFAKLHKARFVRADLTNVVFEHADLSSAEMLGATILGTNLGHSGRGGR